MKKLSIALALVLFFLLFMGGSEIINSRIFYEIWNLGHVLAFALWTGLLLTRWPAARRWSWYRQLLVTGLFALLAGTASELLQTWFRRVPDLADVGRDLLGSALVVAFVSTARHGAPKRVLRPFQALVMVALLVTLLPLGGAILDTGRARAAFPLLADFESLLEAGRWKVYGEVRRVEAPVAHGRFALRIEPAKGGYAGVKFKYLSTDWRSLSTLRFEAYSPAAARLHVRIHDRRHELKRGSVRDRYQRIFQLEKGWNSIVIDLAEVRDSGDGRQLDLGAIWRVGVYISPGAEPVIIDHLRLED
jgi:VanZ family protein